MLYEDSPFAEVKKRILEELEVPKEGVFPLYRDRFTGEMMMFLRLAVVQPDDLDMDEDADEQQAPKPNVTAKPDKAREVVLLLCLLRVSERRALICLRGIVQDLQDAYPTTIQEDEALIRDRQMFELLPRNQRNALRVRYGEKLIIRASLATIDRILNNLGRLKQMEEQEDKQRREMEKSAFGRLSALDTPDRWRKDGVAAGPKDVNGQQGQLIEFNEEKGEWTVATFNADIVAAAESSLRPLTAEDLQDYDITLGPASDTGVMGAELTERLSDQGYAVCVSEGAFTRLAAELESGYLGQEGKGKTLSVDLDSSDTADFLRESPLKTFEDAIETVGTLIRPFVEPELGFDIYSRTSAPRSQMQAAVHTDMLCIFAGTMMSLPFVDESDEEKPGAFFGSIDNEEAANFLSMMWRSKLMILVNAGPGATTLTLTPKAITDSDPIKPQLNINPGMLCVFCMDRYKFSHQSEGKALSLSAFFLDAPREYVLASILFMEFSACGSLLTVSGPPQPKTDSIPVVAMGERYAFGVDEPWKAWVAYAKAGWDTITRHPQQRWDCDTYYDPDADQTSGLSYTCHGGFSDGIELFDCKFFDISPAEARGMDPTQRQVLEVSYISLQGAGWTKKMLQDRKSQAACKAKPQA
eukprot:g5190.t1